MALAWLPPLKTLEPASRGTDQPTGHARAQLLPAHPLSPESGLTTSRREFRTSSRSFRSSDVCMRRSAISETSVACSASMRALSRLRRACRHAGQEQNQR
eukprot:355302-Chlamydomonas_euryale.AAC.7